jgi:cobalt-zinc-cadmium efflux system outer membrane protein
MYFPFGHTLEHKTIRRALLLVVTTFISLPVIAQHTNPLTLAEAEARALSAEPGQQALKARAVALRERGVAAGELPVPTLRVGLNNFPVQSGGFTTEGMTQAAVGLRQAFPAGKTRSINTRRFDLLACELIENAVARGRDVLTAARWAWFDVY